MDGKNITISYRDGSPPTKYVYLGMYSEERAKKDKEDLYRNSLQDRVQKRDKQKRK